VTIGLTVRQSRLDRVRRAKQVPPAEQFGELAGHHRPAVVVRFGAGLVGARAAVPRSRSPLRTERTVGGLAVQVPCDRRNGPPGIGEEHHLQPRAYDGRKVGLTQRLEFGPLGIPEVGATHETFYVSPPACLVSDSFNSKLTQFLSGRQRDRVPRPVIPACISG